MRLLTEHPLDQPPYALPPAAVVAHFGTDPVRGLTRSEAARRLTSAGPNELLLQHGHPRGGCCWPRGRTC